ncbi:WYL domain-containing protein [Runella sp. CRIBMP]|uniref:helix-turn-helix transcriptional regulator n=1 Tax=Runella sp. CRIBMP TaxID=2683261 RepID=UPI00141258D0|nr:WYL domain-containing protein [Runella sp. CRIBMP]NBB21557.1 WYL domain-containing protein [Runella sp. CRIBMP]
MGQKQSADTKLKAILAIHKYLRTGNAYSGEELATICKTDKRTIVDYVPFMRKHLKAEILSSRYYGYKYNPEKHYSILAGLDDTELDTLNELLAVIRQLQHTKELRGLERILLALERQVGIVKGNPNSLIEYEEAELAGREYLDKLYQLIHRKVFIKFLYKGFEMSTATWIVAFPLQLREFNNRWYLVGWAHSKDETNIIQAFPIDRFQLPPAETTESFTCPKEMDLREHFKNIIGITNTGKLITVKLKFHSPIRLQYAITKKIHPSQRSEIDPNDGKTILILEVAWNKELLTKILGFGSDVEVLEPFDLRQKIITKLEQALQRYR